MKTLFLFIAVWLIEISSAMAQTQTQAITVNTVTGTVINTSPSPFNPKFPNLTVTGSLTVGGSLTVAGTLTTLNQILKGSILGDSNGDINLTPSAYVKAPNIAIPTVGAIPIVFHGDSITYGTGTGPSPLTGLNYSYAGYLASMPNVSNASVYAMGIPGQLMPAPGSSNTYFPSGVSTAVTITASSTSGTITGSTSGLSGTMCVGAPGFTPGTTATFSGTTVTFSIAPTVSGSKTLYFCANASVGDYHGFTGADKSSIDLVSAPRLLSPVVTGNPAALGVEFGANDFDLNAVVTTGVITSGSNTITSVGNTGGGVGFFVCGTGIPSGAIITSVPSGTLVFDGPPATASGTITLGICSATNYTNYISYLNSYVAQAVADQWTHIYIFTIQPFYTSQTQACDSVRLMINNYIESTWGAGQVASVSVVNIGAAPEWQSTNPNYLSYYYSDQIHPSALGGQIMAQILGSSISSTLAAGDASLSNFQFMRSGIPSYMLGSGVVTNIQSFGAKGDGITDDTAAIQRALWLGGHVIIPYTGHNYIISDVLLVPSNTWVDADLWAVIFEASGNNVEMIRNADLVTNSGTWTGIQSIDSNIRISGGIWNNNWTGNPGVDPLGIGQTRLKSSKTSPVRGAAGTLGFFGVTGLTLENITVVDPVNFGIQVSACNQFSAKRLNFTRSQTTISDGLHVNGPSSNFRVDDVTGTTGDDLVALNAWDWVDSSPNACQGDISNGTITSLHPTSAGFATLKMGTSSTAWVRNVTVTGITGNAVGGGFVGGTFPDQLVPSHTPGTGGTMENVQLKNINVNVTGASGGEYGAVVYLGGCYQNFSIDGANIDSNNLPVAGQPWMKLNGNAIGSTISISHFECLIDAPISDLFAFGGQTSKYTLTDSNFNGVSGTFTGNNSHNLINITGAIGDIQISNCILQKWAGLFTGNCPVSNEVHGNTFSIYKNLMEVSANGNPTISLVGNKFTGGAGSSIVVATGPSNLVVTSAGNYWDGSGVALSLVGSGGPSWFGFDLGVDSSLISNQAAALMQNNLQLAVANFQGGGSPNTQAGTITATTTSVVGTGTKFTSVYKFGVGSLQEAGGGNIYHVIAVADDTHLTLAETASFSGQAWWGYGPSSISSTPFGKAWTDGRSGDFVYVSQNNGLTAGLTITNPASSSPMAFSINAPSDGSIQFVNKATGTVMATFDQAGNLIAGKAIRFHGYTVSTLPSGTIGDTAYVTDALTPSFGTILVGGGAVVTKCFYNGVNWIAE